MAANRLLALTLSAVAFGPTLAQTCDAMPGGVAGWWPGEANALDMTAVNDGVLIGGVGFVSAADAQGFGLDGTDDRIDVPDSPSLRPQFFTLAAWVQLDAITTQACIICKQVGTGDANSYSLWLQSGVLRGGMFRFAEAAAPAPLPVGRMTHTAVTWDGVVIRLYIDGRVVATSAGPASTVPYDTNQVIIGAEDNGVNAYQAYLDGIIDEPVIYGRALSPCEVRALSRARAHGACKGDSDGDSLRDVSDNCPGVPNLGQQDVDGDGAGDVCDCAPADPEVRAQPGSFPGLQFDTRDAMSWCGETALAGSGTVYDVIRGDLGAFPVGAGTVTCRSRCLPPLPGLTAWWPGDGGTTALVGGAGTLQNGATYGAGWVRSAFALDGNDDRVATPSASIPATFSVAAWVKSEAASQAAYDRIVESSYATDFYLGTDATAGRYKWIVKSPSAPFGAANGGAVVPGEWQLVVGTYDGTIGRLYVDGVLAASDTFAAPGAVTLPLYIGAYFLGGQGWKGQIDEVQVYGRALTATEARVMFEAGSAGQCKAALGGVDALWTIPAAVDLEVPAPDHGFWYLTRGENACGLGSYGTMSNGTPRVSTVCD